MGQPSSYEIVPTRNVSLCRSLFDALGDGWPWEGPEGGNVYWLVRNTSNRKPVGFCSVRPAAYDPSETAFLSQSLVMPSARGRGLQRRMIRVRCQWAKRKGYARAFTYTAVDNVASSKNLVREGFEPYWPPPEVTTVIGPGFHYFAKLL